MSASTTQPARRPGSALATVAMIALLTALLVACSDEDGDGTPATATASGPAPQTATIAASATASPRATGTITTPPPATWPPTLGANPVDAALAALRSGDTTALIALVPRASAACTTALGAGRPPKCPAGVANGTVIEYFPYFQCGGWGSVEGLRDWLNDSSLYPLVVWGWTPPVALRVVSDPAITHTLVLVRGGYGPADAASDARLLTTLAFDGTALREITGDCGAYAQSAFAAGSLPRIAAGASVLWRAYPASSTR